MSDSEQTLSAISVYSPGSKVMLGSVQALVTGVTIRSGGYVVYEVNWWDGADHHCKWLDALEVSGVHGERVPIGFIGRA